MKRARTPGKEESGAPELDVKQKGLGLGGEGNGDEEAVPEESTLGLRVHEWGLNPLFWVSDLIPVLVLLYFTVWVLPPVSPGLTGSVLARATHTSRSIGSDRTSQAPLGENGRRTIRAYIITPIDFRCSRTALRARAYATFELAHMSPDFEAQSPTARHKHTRIQAAVGKH